jgi:hypothetical protein
MKNQSQSASSAASWIVYMTVILFIAVAATAMSIYAIVVFDKTYFNFITNNTTNEITINEENNILNQIFRIIHIDDAINGTFVKTIISGGPTVIINSSNFTYPVVSVIANGTGNTVNITGGVGISVDDSDILYPIIDSLAIIDVFSGQFISINKTNPQYPSLSFNLSSETFIRSLVPGNGINITDLTPSSTEITNNGVINTTGVDFLTVDNSDTQYPVVSITQEEFVFQQTLREPGNFGDPFLLTDLGDGLGLYQSTPQTFWKNAAIMNVTNPTFEGGADSRVVTMTTDNSGNVFIAGGDVYGNITIGSTYNSICATDYSCTFLAKADPSGNWINGILIYEGPTGYSSIVTGSDNYIYGVGIVSGDAAEVVIGNISLPLRCGLFITKSDTDNNIIWINYLNNTINSDIYGAEIAEKDGFLYVVFNQLFFNANLSFVIGDAYITLPLTNDVKYIIGKFNSTTGECLWLRDFFCAFCGQHGIGPLAFDTNGNLYIGGMLVTIFNPFNPVPGNLSITSTSFSFLCGYGYECYYVASIDPSGTWLNLFSDNYGEFYSTFYDRRFLIGFGINSRDEIFFTGSFNGVINFTGIPSTTSVRDTFFIIRGYINGTWDKIFYASQSVSSGSIGAIFTIGEDDNIYIPGGFFGNTTFNNITLSYPDGTGISASQNSKPFFLKMTHDLEVIWVNTNTASFPNPVPNTINGAWISTYNPITKTAYMVGYTREEIQFDNHFLVPELMYTSGQFESYWVSVPQNFTSAQLVVLLQSGSQNEVVNAQTNGVISGFTGLTPGAFYYYDYFAESLTTTPTSYLVGYAISSTELFFDPQPIYVVIT